MRKIQNAILYYKLFMKIGECLSLKFFEPHRNIGIDHIDFYVLLLRLCAYVVTEFKLTHYQKSAKSIVLSTKNRKRLI